ncbi:hypothetical protein FRB99_007721 [Tulasnella sp. 403]|nr:hypothetical protein FRB99_007721 [Tulasnella sp. 403]
MKWDTQDAVNTAWRMTLVAIESSEAAKLKDAIILSGSVIDMCRDNPALCSYILDCLSGAHHTIFKKTGEVGHVKKAVEAQEEAVNLCPPSHPDQPAHLSNLASILSTRFRISGNMKDLDRCIKLREQVLATGPLSK